MSLRIGIDSGPVVAGIIGAKKFAYDIWGPAVSRASSMESLGASGSIQITAATYAKLHAAYICESRGVFYISGEGEVETYLLQGKRRQPLP